MKFIKSLLFCDLVTTMLAGCAAYYDVDLLLNRSGSYASFGEQTVFYEISTEDVNNYGIKLADKLESKMIKDNKYLEGKEFTLTRLSDTSFSVTAKGESTYDFGEYSSAEFMIYFEDSLINKSGFHSFTTSLVNKAGMRYMSSSYSKVGNIYSTIGSAELIGAKSVVADWSTEGLVSLSNVTSGSVSITKGELGLEISLNKVVVEEDKNPIISFTAQCFDINKPLDLTIKFLLVYSTYAFF